MSSQWTGIGCFQPGVARPENRVFPSVPLLRNQQQPTQPKKSRRGPRSRSSQYRGVTFYRRTGRWESHIWDCGKQVYLGGFDTAHAAARAYDRAAIKFRGIEADINFNLSDYEEDMNQMKNLSKEEFVHALRRQSTCFSRGSSKYRGVTLHKCGRWEARMGQFLGKKAYDKAAIKFNGREAVTNFEPSSYDGELLAELDGEGHELDLDLRLSPPVVQSPKMDANSMSGVQQDSRSFDGFEQKKPKLFDATSSSTLLPVWPQPPLTMQPDHPNAWPARPAAFISSGKLAAKTMNPEFAGGPREDQSWAGWQIDHRTTPLPLFPSAAASSGFAETAAAKTTTTPTAALHTPVPPVSSKSSPRVGSSLHSFHFRAL